MANEWVVKTGIIEETKLLQIMSSIYEDLASWFGQWKNISLEFVDIEKENLRRTLDDDLPEDADWLFFPCELTLFSAERTSNSPRLSLAADTTSTYILSETPAKKIIPSLHFLIMQSEFICCLLASLIFISALMSAINRLSRLRTPFTLKDFGHQFLENVWRNSLLFFYEPIIRTLRILSWRIVASVWLIALSFIYIEMCGNLKSKFIETEYVFIDSMANLPRNRYREVFVIKDLVEEGFINKMAEIDDNYRELKEQMQRVHPDYLLFDPPTNRVVIMAEYLAKIGMKEIYTLTSVAPPRGRVAFSEPLYSTFLVFPIAQNATSRTVDAINGLALLVMEMKVMAKYFIEMDFLFFGSKWTRPVETFEDMTFGDIKSVVDLFVLGSILAGLLLIVEYSTAVLREMLSFSSRQG